MIASWISSRRLRLLAALCGLSLCLSLLLPAPARAAVGVAITSPPEGEVVFGPVEFEAQLSGRGPHIQKVEFYIDGVRGGVVEQAPWRVVYDVGQDNKDHRFEVVVYDSTGAVATASRRSATVQTDEVINVQLQQLYVSVEGGASRKLTRDDFTVTDQGTRQKIVTFEGGDVPFTAVLLVDSSSSMEGGRLTTALDGARGFFNGMNHLDEGMLVLFSDHVQMETPFTSVPAILTLGLSDVQPGGGTALNDALYLGLKKLEPQQGRKVIVILSDGVDVESVLPMERVKEIAGRSQAAVYWLRVRRDEDAVSGPVKRYSVWRGPEVHDRQLELLKSVVEASGGRIQEIGSVAEVGKALTGLLRELREQYVLGYYPSQSKGAGTFHQVEVHASGVRLRVHRGYTEQ